MKPALAATLVLATLAAQTSAGCRSVPTGPGVYLVTVIDAASGKPAEGVALTASGAGLRSRGGAPATAITDEDGEATLAFGNWGSIDLAVDSGSAAGRREERWLVAQDRIAVNGGRASRDPLRLIVGSGPQGGSSRYALSITRVERGPKVDN